MYATALPSGAIAAPRMLPEVVSCRCDGVTSRGAAGDDGDRDDDGDCDDDGPRACKAPRNAAAPPMATNSAGAISRHGRRPRRIVVDACTRAAAKRSTSALSSAESLVGCTVAP